MTKLYLHREGVGTLPSGTLPSAEQSSLAPDVNLFDNEDGSENRSMNTTISGQAQTTLTNTSTGDVSAHNYYIARWVSPVLYQPSVAANTWNLKFSATESNANANFPRSGAGVLRVNVYVWKPSDGTKVGTILDGDTAADGEEAGTSQTLMECTFSGSAVSGLTPGDACIVYEMWAIVTQANTTTRTQTVQYDGTTESSTSNNAAHIETPETLNFTETKGNMTAINASSSSTVSTANTTQYLPVVGNLEFTTTEDTVEAVFRKAGTLSNLGVRLTANTITGNTTFTIRKNGVDTSLVCTFGSSATGYQEDSTNTVTVAAGDTISLETTPGGATNTFTIKDLIVHFTATDGNTTHILGSSQANNLTLASTTRYIPISGRSVSTATENDAEVEQRVAGTYSKFQIYVSSNARTTSTTFKSRKNNADGNLSITVGAGATGVFEDTSNSDTVASTDDYNFAAVTGTGTETLTYTILKVEFEPTTARKGVTPSNNPGSSNVQNANVTQFYPVGGPTVPLNTEADYKRRFKNSKITFTEMHIWLSSNTVTANSTATLRVNGANSTITCTLTASTAGAFSDTAHSVIVGPNDDVNVQIATGATGTSMGVAMIVLYYDIVGPIAYNRTINTETTSSTESTTRLLAATRTIATETTSVSETVARIVGAMRPIGTETVAITDSVARVVETPSNNFERSINETVVISDTLARMLAANRTLQEDTVISETLTRLLAANRSIETETTNITDQVARSFGAVRAPATETVTSSDSIQRLLAATRTIQTESTIITDAVARLLAANRALLETTTITDSVVGLQQGPGATNYERSIIETVVISDSVTRIKGAVRTLQTENVISSDSVNRLLAATRQMLEEVSQLDSLNRLLAASRSIQTETVSVSDSVTRLLTRVRSIVENVNINDAITRAFVGARPIIEAVPVVDTIIRVLTPFELPTRLKKIRQWLTSKYDIGDPSL